MKHVQSGCEPPQAASVYEVVQADTQSSGEHMELKDNIAYVSCVPK